MWGYYCGLSVIQVSFMLSDNSAKKYNILERDLKNFNRAKFVTEHFDREVTSRILRRTTSMCQLQILLLI